MSVAMKNPVWMVGLFFNTSNFSMAECENLLSFWS